MRGRQDPQITMLALVGRSVPNCELSGGWSRCKELVRGLLLGPRVSDPPELKASPSRRGHTTPHKRTGEQSRPDYRDCASAKTRQ